MKTKTFLVNLGILLLSFSAAAQTACPDEKGNCFLRDLWVGEAPTDLNNSSSGAFSCPEGQFATGLTISSSVLEFGQDVTELVSSSFGIPLSEPYREVRYIRPVNWITQLHCESGEINIDLPEVFADNDPVHRKTFATTDIRCDEGKIVTGMTLLSHNPASEQGKSLRRYFQGLRLACAPKAGGETTYTDILGFDMAESFCKIEWVNSFFVYGATKPYTTVCSSTFNEWDWEHTDRFENLEMEFSPDRAFGFVTRRKWSELPDSGTGEEKCPEENWALSEITLHYNGEQNNLIGIGQNCREFRQKRATRPGESPDAASSPDPETVANASSTPAPRREARKPNETAIARKKEKMRKGPKRGSEKVKTKNSPTPAPTGQNPSPKLPEEDDDFIPFPNTPSAKPGDNPSVGNDLEISAQSPSGGGSWYSCALRPKNAEADTGSLPLLLLVGFWLLWNQKKGKEV